MDARVERYYKFYLDQAAGGSYANLEPFRRQRGRGLGDFLAGLFRRVLPFISGGAKALGAELVETTVELIKDHLKGKDAKSSLDARVKEAGTRLSEKAATSLKGMVGLGIKRQRKRATSQSCAYSRVCNSSISKRNNSKRKKIISKKKEDIFGNL
jgi:hypothetical protein